MLRTGLAIIVGIVVASIVIMVVEMLGHTIYPPPADVDIHDMEQLKAYLDIAPIMGLLFVPLAYLLGSIVGGATTAAIATETPKKAAIILGGILTILGVMNLIFIPHPLWMMVLIPFIFVPASILGAQLALKQKL